MTTQFPQLQLLLMYIRFPIFQNRARYPFWLHFFKRFRCLCRVPGVCVCCVCVCVGGGGGGGSHVMVVSTYVPTKMGQFFKLQYTFMWILKAFGLQKSTKYMSLHLLIGIYGSLFLLSVDIQMSLFWFHQQNITGWSISQTRVHLRPSGVQTT